MATYAPPRSTALRSTLTHGADGRAAALPRDRPWLLPLLVVLAAAALFSLHLGNASLFIDEVYSWRASRGSLVDLVDAVRYGEVTPPLYYLVLRAWMQVTGGDAEWLLRLPSVLAGVALVGAVHWLGRLVAGRTCGLIACSLAAISPLVLMYSQQVRAYVWVMLAVAIAVAAAIEATRGRSSRWLAVAGAACACAILLHYTALLVLVPLAAWLWLQPEFGVRTRLAFVAAAGIPLAALVPLLMFQTSQGHQGAAGLYASLTTFNALRVVGTPFDGRASGGLVLWREIGAVVVIDAIALLALLERYRAVTARWLIVACGAFPLAAVCLLGAVGQPTAMTRYTAVAAPFIFVAIGVVAAHSHRVLATILLAGALAASGAGLVTSQRVSGQNPDTRGVLTAVAADIRAGDAVLSVGLLGFDNSLLYYGERLLPAGSREISAYPTLDVALRDPRILDVAGASGALWIVAQGPLSRAQLDGALAGIDYTVRSARVFEGNAPVQLVRAEWSRRQ